MMCTELLLTCIFILLIYFVLEMKALRDAIAYYLKLDKPNQTTMNHAKMGTLNAQGQKTETRASQELTLRLAGDRRNRLGLGWPRHSHPAQCDICIRGHLVTSALEIGPLDRL